MLSAGFGKVHQQLLTQVGVGHFTAAEADADLDPVAILQELLCVLDLGIEVIGINTGAHADFLDLHNLLVLLGFLLTLLLIEAELGIVHDFTDGGNCVGGDLHQVQTLFLCQGICLSSGHDTQLGTVFTDDAKLLVADFLIELMI